MDFSENNEETFTGDVYLSISFLFLEGGHCNFFIDFFEFI